MKGDLKLYIPGKKLEVVDQVKSLGLIIDENLRFKHHVNMLMKNATAP